MPINFILSKKFLDPYIWLDPQRTTFPEKVTCQKTFFAVSGIFYIKMNIFQGYFHSKTNFRLKSIHTNMVSKDAEFNDDLIHIKLP
jgi:hypothetical protein